LLLGFRHRCRVQAKRRILAFAKPLPAAHLTHPARIRLYAVPSNCERGWSLR
jgi:hypothetical protein